MDRLPLSRQIQRRMENHQCVVGVEAETRRPIDVHARETVIHNRPQDESRVFMRGLSQDASFQRLQTLPRIFCSESDLMATRYQHFLTEAVGHN